MYMTKRVLAGVAALLGCLGATVSSAQTPAVVAAALKDLTNMCTEAGGKPLAADAVKRADLNADGKEDYVLDGGSVGCDGFASLYGDREKGVTVYVGDGKGGAKQAFSDMTFGMKIEGTGPAAKLWLTVSGAGCGKEPAADFASESFCDRPLAWNAKKQEFDYAPVSTVKMIE
jgi:hypothetical protein